MGHNEEVIAVGVIGCVSCNRNPHVTATWASKGDGTCRCFRLKGQLKPIETTGTGTIVWETLLGNNSLNVNTVNTFVLLFSGAMLVSGRLYVPASYPCRDLVLQSFR